MASRSFSHSGAGRPLKRLNQPSGPALAVAARSGLASTKEATRTKPKTSDQKTACSMPRGTATRAFTVSSAVWAEASKPVIV